MSGRTKALGAIGVAAAVAIGGTIAVSAAGTSGAQSPGSTTSTTRPTVPGAAGDGSGPVAGSGMRGAMGAFALLRDALHGDFVVAADDSTGTATATTTERLQRGAVTAQSATSLTVRSTDGYSWSYTIPSGADLRGVTTGTSVLVIATLDGSTATAVSVMALTAGTAGGVPGPGDGTGPGPAGPGAPDGTGNSGRGGSGATATSSATTA